MTTEAKYLNPDGTLILADWAEAVVGSGSTLLKIDHGVREHPMYGSPATGSPLVTNGHLGVDLIRVPAGGGFAPHTHPGDHLLIVVAGEGTITYEGRIYPTHAGQVYMVEGEVPHAVGAVTDHLILAVGSPHRPVNSADRMTLTAYEAVGADMGALTCLACGRSGSPFQLEQAGCSHVPVRPGSGRLLFVGIAPAGEEHLTDPAFHGTRSGDRLAALLGVSTLVDVVDTTNLFPGFLGDWQTLGADAWRQAGRELRPTLSNRVVVACGGKVARALGSERVDVGLVDLVDVAEGRPYLVLTIPHPSGLSRSWNDPATSALVTRALRVARSLAQAGSPTGEWERRDADALEAITLPAMA